MDEWEKLNETSWLEKEEIYSNLNMNDIIDQIAIMQKEFVNILKQNILVNIMICILKVIYCYWLMFLKALEKMCLVIYELNPAIFFSSQISLASSFKKKNKVKLK